MRKRILIALMLAMISLLVFVGCQNTPKGVGNLTSQGVKDSGDSPKIIDKDFAQKVNLLQNEMKKFSQSGNPLPPKDINEISISCTKLFKEVLSAKGSIVATAKDILGEETGYYIKFGKEISIGKAKYRLVEFGNTEYADGSKLNLFLQEVTEKKEPLVTDVISLTNTASGIEKLDNYDFVNSGNSYYVVAFSKFYGADVNLVKLYGFKLESEKLSPFTFVCTDSNEKWEVDSSSISGVWNIQYKSATKDYKFSKDNNLFKIEALGKAGDVLSEIKFSSNSANTVSDSIFGNSTGNIYGGGLFAQEGEWIYYSNNADDKKLYKMKFDTTDKKKISDDVAESINVYDGWIYFLSENKSTLRKELFRIKIDGTVKQKVTEDDCGEVIINNNYVFYINGSDKFNLYKMNLDGTNKKKILNKTIENFDIEDQWVYVNVTISEKDSELEKIQVDGSNETNITNDECYSLQVKDGWIYYSNFNDNHKIYKIKVDGTGKTKILNEESKRINVQGDWIYYINEYYWNIYKVKIDGTNKTKLTSAECENLHVMDGWIYYNVVKENVESPGNPTYYHFRMKTDGTDNMKIE